MYECPTFDGYEVVRYGEQPLKVASFGGQVAIYPAGFRYPSTDEFGKNGFSYRHFDAALRRFNTMEYGQRPERYVTLR